MMIELFGIPGSGKSTICQIVAERSDVIDIMDRYLNSVVGKIKMHLFWKLFPLMNRGLREKYNEMQDVISGDYTNEFDSKISIDKYLRFMLFSYYLGKKHRDKNIIFDEGIVHYCLALHAEFSVDLVTLQRLLKIMEASDRISIGVELDIDTIKKQIKLRDRHVTMIDDLDEKKMNILLYRYQVAYNLFAGVYDSYNRNIVIDEVQKRLEGSNKW